MDITAQISGTDHPATSPSGPDRIGPAVVASAAPTKQSRAKRGPQRFIADLLSGANLACGLYSMVFAAHGRVDLSVLMLLLGATLDGFDGAAARRWGGTRWGVYSDDIADGVNYGVAPGVALYFAVSGLEGALLGLAFALFTIGRLVFFTLNKDAADPEYFSGVPSTVGGLIVLSSILLFQDSPALLGLMVGVACVEMVSFDTLHRHLGRAVARHQRRTLLATPVALALFAGCWRFYGIDACAAVILGACLLYALRPTAMHFQRVISRRWVARHAR